MPIERSPVKDEPEHRINDEDAIGTGMSSPFAEAGKPLTNKRTLAFVPMKSAFDPKRPSLVLASLSAAKPTQRTGKVPDASTLTGNIVVSTREACNATPQYPYVYHWAHFSQRY